VRKVETCPIAHAMRIPFLFRAGRAGSCHARHNKFRWENFYVVSTLLIQIADLAASPTTISSRSENYNSRNRDSSEYDPSLAWNEALSRSAFQVDREWFRFYSRARARANIILLPRAKRFSLERDLE